MSNANRITILLAPEGNYLSHVSRLLVVGRELREHGVRVVFACGGRFAPMVRAYGFDWHPLLTSGMPGQMERARKFGCYYDRALVRAYVDAEVECLSRIRPDLVVSDMRPTMGISTELLGFEHAALVNTYLTRFDASPLDPPRTMPIARLVGPALFPVARKAFLRLAARPFNQEREKWGLAPWHDVLDSLQGRTLTLLADHPDFVPVHPLPSGVHVIGPILWQPDLPTPVVAAGPNPCRPTIYFSCGSSGPDGLLGRLCDALGREPVQVMVGGAEHENLPENFRAIPLAPGIEMARRSDLVVCHGGNGTVYQALSVGRPILAIPRFYEQEFNVNRIMRLGLGRGLWETTARALREAIYSVLNDPGYRLRAERFSTVFRELNAVQTAGRLISDRFELAKRRPTNHATASLLGVSAV